VDKIESTIGKGIIAGFVATFLLSALLDPIALVTKSVWPSSPAIGWLLHYFIGTVIWGVGFAMLHDRLPGASWLRGLVFAIGAWIAVMAAAAALTQARLLAIDLDLATAAATLIIHLLYGVALGLIYGWLLDPDQSPTNEHHDEPMRPIAR